MKNKIVSIVMGSDSDISVMEEASKILNDFGVGYEFTISSAHRSPDRTRQYIDGLKQNGIKIVIAGAGGAAHLAGVIAAESVIPVIGVPIDSSPVKGIDSIFSTLQMPSGVPVATMALGKAGAKNAAILALQILALSDIEIYKQLIDYKNRLEKLVEEKAKRLDEKREKDNKT
ncbi:MAG: 5-(carboxyamino)imidazole ribonucleotide mutase [Nitrospirota bacterium]